MDKVIVYQGDDGQYYWHRVAPNGQVVSDGSEGYIDEYNARLAAQRVNGEQVAYEWPTP